MFGPKAFSGALWATWTLLSASLAAATPLDFIPAGDPLEEEIRVLEVSGAPLRLPRLGMLPNQVVDLPALDSTLTGPAEIARLRILRSIARDRRLQGVSGATPRLLQFRGEPDERFELSTALEGRGIVAQDQRPRLGSGSGLRARFGVEVGRWLAFADVIAGHVEGATAHAERILNNDAVLLTDHSSLSYTGERERWGVTLGRGRWNWGPGEEGSLVLSKTSPAFTAMTLRLRIEALKADAMILNATLRSASGMQLAAHRLEWQPRDYVRIGYSEAVRYRASSWEPLYFVGVIPFSIAQSLLVSDEPESLGTLRNNVIAGVDAAWRVTPGTRIYGEILIDDLRTDDSHIVSKYAYQMGWEGVGTVRGTRVRWGTEYTRLTRFVYTSFYDQSFVVSGSPLGFPTGPDSRRARVRITWDPSVDWQVFTNASRTDQGESGLDDPYLPGAPYVDVGTFEGVVETTRQVEAGIRYWPASGIDLAWTAGFQWVRNPGHVEGETRRVPYAALSLRLTR